MFRQRLQLERTLSVWAMGEGERRGPGLPCSAGGSSSNVRCLGERPRALRSGLLRSAHTAVSVSQPESSPRTRTAPTRIPAAPSAALRCPRSHRGCAAPITTTPTVAAPAAFSASAALCAFAPVVQVSSISSTASPSRRRLATYLPGSPRSTPRRTDLTARAGARSDPQSGARVDRRCRGGGDVRRAPHRSTAPSSRR